MRSTVTIWKSQTYMKVTDYHPDFINTVIMPFARRRLYKFGQIPIPGTRKKKTIVTHCFGKFNLDKSEFRISIGFLDDFLSFMRGVGYNTSRVVFKDVPVYEGKDVTFQWREGWGATRPHQEDWCEYQLESGPIKVNNAATGQGKEQAIDAPVLTPNGFVKMGDLKEGDKVIAKDRSVATVDRVFPQGVKPLYNMTLEDGRVVESGLNHLWLVVSDGLWEVTTTSDIMDRLSVSDFSIPLINPVPLPDDSPYRYEIKTLLEKEVSQFSSVSLSWLKGLQSLIWELGGKAELVESNTEVKFLKAEFPKHPDNRLIEIKSVEFSREFEAQCIMIDHPDHLYVTTDYVVTHNTFMSIHTMVNTGKRTLITCLPRYVPIWIRSLGEALVLNPEDVMLLDEGDLHVSAELIKEGKVDPKIIIVPLTRYDVHFRREKDQEIPELDQVFEDMDIGIRIMDEAHEEVYRTYISMLFGDFFKTIVLSATLKADDPFINTMYEVMYPLKHRLKEPEYTKYIDVYAYHHFIDMAKYRINSKGFGGYSHVKYEQAILKNKALFKGYTELCLKAFKEFFLDEYIEGQKTIWFFSTVEMATRIKEEFAKVYPDYDLWVFTSKESKNKETKMSYAEHDHVFTTPQSCGTGKDIPKLFVAFSPYACSSRQRNDQMLGRTRPVDKWFPGLNPKFVYFVCRNIPKQMEYHTKRKGLFGNKSKSHTNINSFHYIE